MDELDLFVIDLEDIPDVLLLFEDGVPAGEEAGMETGPGSLAQMLFQQPRRMGRRERNEAEAETLFEESLMRLL